MPHLQEVADELADEPVTLLMVTDEAAEKIGRFIEDRPLPGWVVVDEDKSSFATFAVKARPRTIILDAGGTWLLDIKPQQLTAELVRRVIRGEVQAGQDPTAAPLGPKAAPPAKFGDFELLTGSEGPIRSGHHGLASPAVYDYDGDGNKDLLIGERGTGPSMLKVFKNVGSNQAPKFTGDSLYARTVSGRSIYVDGPQGLGFGPRLVDLDGDGHLDLFSGRRDPGVVTWFRGSAEGFHDGVALPWDEDPWEVCAPCFADIDGDGDYDLVLGGGGELWLSLNVGTETEPKFGKRGPLLDIDGEPVGTDIRGWTREAELTPQAVDWDADGILDLLVTDRWLTEQQVGLTFYKGLEDGRFEKGRPLFEGKWLCGSAPLICPTDWNEDGKLDLLVGVSITTVIDEHPEPVNTGYVYILYGK